MVIEADVVVAEVMTPAEVAAEIARLRSPVAEICGSSWAAHDVDVVACGEFGEAGRDDVGVAPRGEGQRLFAGGGQNRALARQGQAAGRVADGAGIIGPADLELALGGDPLRRRLLERGLRLGDVGTGQLADLGTDAGRFELLAEDIFVVAVDREQVLVAHDVEISLRHRL